MHLDSPRPSKRQASRSDSGVNNNGNINDLPHGTHRCRASRRAWIVYQSHTCCRNDTIAAQIPQLMQKMTHLMQERHTFDGEKCFVMIDNLPYNQPCAMADLMHRMKS